MNNITSVFAELVLKTFGMNLFSIVATPLECLSKRGKKAKFQVDFVGRVAAGGGHSLSWMYFGGIDYPFPSLLFSFADELSIYSSPVLSELQQTLMNLS